MSTLSIPVLFGTAREGNASEPAAKYIHALLKARAIETALVLPRDYHDKKTLERAAPKPWAELMANADGLVIVTPEYNHGYPGGLKEMIDALYDEYARKPVAICGVSAGGLGGARVVEQLRQVMVELHMCPIREAVYFSNIRDLFNPDGSPTDPSLEKRCNVMFEELFWFARVLKAGREGTV
ncbi:MAG TPA: NADPH-dependent FMN reductase [Candidatus Methylomirabilis sp.]|nr:NADPH-dependent FMN reductase [Candidatus Methylomirabilis sp.]